ncbi:hypothetical protein QYE76_026083 [Lolium multiflorum]|uniref:Uncharacterized protein n=1 Tax=Lolium multiflorum TaxID=4521 RepID=A0AAD8RGY2_LOLMU|nr:hypothetical protein QYE76_026083 [Lolium multiflorum]
MGKKKSGSTSEAVKVSRDWSASAISNRDINKLRALGFISASEEDICLPALAADPKFYPSPFHIYHRLRSLPRIEPHWGLWRKIFYVKRHNDSNGPPVVGGVGFVVRKEVDYFDYPMKESVQGWRNKWFYLRDPAISGRRSNLPPFDDVLVAHKKKSWNNALSPEEKATADELFKQIVTLKNSGGMTMRGTEVVSVFLQRRVQPLMSRPHQLWLFTGKNDKSRVNSADLSAEELQNEVRRLTCLSSKDTIILTSARPPYDFKHLPSEVPAVAQCYPPSPESGVVLEDDDDDSEGTEDAQHALEDSDVQEEETAEDDAFLKSRRRKQPIYAYVDAVVDFAEQFTRLEAENAQLRKAVKSSADQAIEANRIAADAKSENALLKEEVTRLKRQIKDDQDARRAAAAAIDKKEGVLRESVKDLLGRQFNCHRRHQLREDSTADALSLAAESNVQILRLLQKSKGALSKLYSMIFPKAKLDKTLDEMAEAFLVDPSDPVEVLKRRSRLIGAVLTFQLLMGHGMGSELEEFSKALPVNDENHLVNLEPFKRSAITCANRLLKLVDEAQAEPAPESAPGSTSANP